MKRQAALPERTLRSSATTDRTASRLAWIAFGLIGLLLLATLVLSWINASGENRGDVLGNALLALAMFTFPAVGALIASRHPRNAIGWILLAIGLVWELVGVTDGYVKYGLVTHPGAVPRPDLALALSSWLWVPGVGLIGTFLILLFPDGRLPSPRWRPLAWTTAISLTVASAFILVAPGPFEAPYSNLESPLGVEVLRPIAPVFYVALLSIPLCIVGCAASLLQRFRRSRGSERLQLKWLAASAGASAAAYLVAMIVSIPYDWGPTAPLWVEIIQNIALFSFLLIPLAAGMAILRHRLYDIDLIINRTLVYGAMTVSLALVYAGGVFVLGGTLRSVTGQQGNSLAVAGSTLAVAGLFRPVRSWMQSFIDRRFYRHKYDAAKTLEHFSARMRDEIDLDSLISELVAVVSRALQPSQVTLWIKPPSEP